VKLLPLFEAVELDEGRIGEVRSGLMYFDVHYIPHFQHRTVRHLDKHVVIRQDEILTLVSRGMQKLLDAIRDGHIKNQKRFILSDGAPPFLNVIFEAYKLTEYRWRLVVITVMKKDRFHPGTTFQIII